MSYNTIGYHLQQRVGKAVRGRTVQGNGMGRQWLPAMTQAEKPFLHHR
jgi:hypothetical protein